MDVGAIDELVALHVKSRLSLAWNLPIGAGIPRANFNGDTPVETVTELLRLARLGAIAEAEARLHPDRPLVGVVGDARRRWRLELGLGG